MTRAIVHVVRQYAPSVGGLEAVVAQLAAEQTKQLGHDVRIVTLDRVFGDPGHRLPAAEIIDGIPVERLPWSGSSRYPLCPRVLTALGDADIVHVHAIDFFFDFLAATSRLHGKTLVASTHGGFFHTGFLSSLKRAWFHTATRLSCTAYQRIVAISDGDGEMFRRIAPSRVRVIENGVDIERFRDAASPVTTPTLLYFGRWSSNKGLERLIELVAAIRRLDRRFRLVIAGRPSDLTAADLARHASAHGIPDAVDIVASPSDGDLRGFMAHASHFACLSSYEGFGLAAIEAMSAGLVPLLSDIPSFRKIVVGSQVGRLIGDEGPDVAAAAIVADHARAAPIHATERAAAIAFAQRYEWGQVARRFDEVYREAATRDREARIDAPVRAPR